jgi:hypothetical protein
MSRRRLALAAGALLLTALTGCSAATTDAGSTPAPVATATTTPTPTATPTPAATVDPEDYTCETILLPSILADYEAKEDDGFELQADFVERSRTFGAPIVDFVDYGGILCAWGYPSGETIDYGFSAITADQQADQLAQLMAGGFVEEPDDRGTLVVNVDPAAITDTYLFTEGYWFYGSDGDVLDLIVNNIPAL